MIEFLLTTDPKVILDWMATLFFSVLSLFVIILAGSFVAKILIETWGVGKWL